MVCRVSIFGVHNELNLFAFAHREYHLRSSFLTTDNTDFTDNLACAREAESKLGGFA